MRHRTMLLAALAIVIASGTACGGVGVSEESDKATQESRDDSAGGALADAGITMRLKTTYLFNEHLDAIRINVDTEGRHVTLEGTVSSDIERDLAGEIAENVEGVESVTNRLRVSDAEAEEPEEPDRSFGQAVADATMTASVKMALAVEAGVKASEIDVDTSLGVVTLTGDVGTRAERTLAGKTAEDVSGVQKVVNRIEVRS